MIATEFHDLHHWEDDDTWPHQFSAGCPCRPAERTVYPTAINPDQRVRLFQHRLGGPDPATAQMRDAVCPG